MSKEIVFNSEAREKLKRGIDALCNAVKVTLGPKGRNVIFNEYGREVTMTKDGVTVAKEVILKDPIENMGAQMVREASSKTADSVGDGTTTSAVLAQAMITAGMKNVVAGANPMDIKRGIDKATKVVVDDLAKQAELVGDNYDKIAQIGTVSANNDSEIGSLIAGAMKRVGKDGIITVEESRSVETRVEETQGLMFDRGYISPYMVTDVETMKVEYEKPLILIYDRRLSAAQELIPILTKWLEQAPGQPLLIIADEFDNQCMGLLVENKVRGGMKVVGVKSPGFGDRRKAMLDDIAIATGGTVISAEKGMNLDTAEVTHFGTCDKIIIDKDDTIIINGNGDPEAIKMRKNMIKQQIESSKSDYDTEKLRERLAKLSGGVAILYVGAQTELELKEKKARVDDALHATKAAMAEGIVTGGGVALVRAMTSLAGLNGANEDENIGIQIVRKALESPIRTIAENAGMEGSVIMDKVLSKEGPWGYNARTNVFEDLNAAGVIDPKMVTRIALENAASIAGMILTTECVIADIPEPTNNAPDMRSMM